ncbi:MAG: fumarylacetoacetate hydrolase family protein [Hyphomicrobiaceae bacterium]|nr:fumarylacetoacetate hydrolase family protein [Hyphomicrobiaceae bacterium]
MRFVRFGDSGQEKPGLLDAEGRLRDLSGRIADLADETLDPDTLTAISADGGAGLPLVEGTPRLGPPIARIGHFIGVGLNYADHAEEAGMAIPAEPILFTKAPGSLAGPEDPLILPEGALKADWEVELAVIIGRRGYRVGVEEAPSLIAGYAICNDISERAWQIETTGTWIKGKGAPGFGPLGPWLVTPDAIPDPQNLAMKLDLNGEARQRGSSATMIFGVAECISWASRYFELMPGDVITTGTPPGVGMGMKPQRFLKDGDVMELEIDGLGRQRTRVSAP